MKMSFFLVSRVVFHFKSSSLSNNGTNLSSGQIPQLLYKILTPEFYVVTNFESPPSVAVHILSKKFSHSVSEVGEFLHFEARTQTALY